MHIFVTVSIVFYIDDDDNYPPERMSHAVEKLQGNTSALCAGSSEIYIYFKHINAMYQCGPYGPNHATAGTFAFRTELLKHTKYEETAAVAEERAFLKDYTVPFVQLDPLKTILVFSHEHNSFDKRKMLIDMHPQFMRVSDKTVDTFIRKKNEKSIKNFFLNEITGLLKKYEQGEAKMKPDVLKQIAEIEKERETMKEMLTKQAANNGPIMLQRPGEEPMQLSNQDVVNMLMQQQNLINELNQKLQQSGGSSGGTGNSGGDSSVLQQRISDLENMVSMLQKQLIEKTKLVKTLNVEINELKTKLSNEQSKNAKNNEKEDAKFFKVPIEIIEITPPKKPKTKSDPEVMVDVSD